jgi:hypothetical protein
MTQLFAADTAEKIACLRRELEQRRSVYPRLIEKGRMTKQRAEREIEIMQAILADYESTR